MTLGTDCTRLWGCSSCTKHQSSENIVPQFWWWWTRVLYNISGKSQSRLRLQEISPEMFHHGIKLIIQNFAVSLPSKSWSEPQEMTRIKTYVFPLIYSTFMSDDLSVIKNERSGYWLHMCTDMRSLPCWPRPQSSWIRGRKEEKKA